MHPELNFFGSKVSAYGILAAAGLIAMGILAFILGRKRRLIFEDFLFGELFMLIGAFLGSHLLYGLTNIRALWYYLSMSVKNHWGAKIFFQILIQYLDGMVFYGGLLAAIGFGAWYCKMRKLNLGDYSDCFAVGIPLFHCVARVGCFMTGCCYGIKSDFGFTTTESLVHSADGVNRFPVQLLESGVNLLIFVALLILFKKGIMKRQLLLCYLTVYGVARFFIEFLRGDAYRGIYFGLSTSQWISIAVVAVSLILLIKNKKGVKKNENL